MERDLLSATEAARRLGISRLTLYQWLADSNAGTLVIRGQPVTIDYFQSGPRGQGSEYYTQKRSSGGANPRALRVAPRALKR